MPKIEEINVKFVENSFSIAEYAEKMGYSSHQCVSCQQLYRWCNGHNPLCPVSDNFMFG
jgi:hypothetical protein